MTDRPDRVMTEPYLDALTLEDVETARLWHQPAAVRAGLRTPYPLTAEQQAAFYRDVVCNRHAPHRYMAMRSPNSVSIRAMVGLVGIQWENGLAEISLIVGPDEPKGTGRAAVGLALRWAFDDLRLSTVWGECYESNQAIGFWKKIVAEHPGASAVILPRRKFWARQFWNSYVFTLPCP